MTTQESDAPVKSSAQPIDHQQFNIAYTEVMQVRLGSEIVLIPVPDVSEVTHTQTLTRVPMAPDHLLGVCNIHGQVVCVIDPCRVMSVPYSDKKNHDNIRFMVLNHPKMHLALQVDEILSLLQIPQDEFEQAKQITSDFFCGSLTLNQQAYRILHTAALFK